MASARKTARTARGPSSPRERDPRVVERRQHRHHHGTHERKAHEREHEAHRLPGGVLESLGRRRTRRPGSRPATPADHAGHEAGAQEASEEPPRALAETAEAAAPRPCPAGPRGRRRPTARSGPARPPPWPRTGAGPRARATPARAWPRRTGSPRTRRAARRRRARTRAGAAGARPPAAPPEVPAAGSAATAAPPGAVCGSRARSRGERPSGTRRYIPRNAMACWTTNSREALQRVAARRSGSARRASLSRSRSSGRGAIVAETTRSLRSYRQRAQRAPGSKVRFSGGAPPSKRRVTSTGSVHLAQPAQLHRAAVERGAVLRGLLGVAGG